MVKSNKKGLTLVELLIVLAIGTVVMTVIYSYFSGNTKILNTAESGVDLQSNGEKAQKSFQEEAISAKKINYIKFFEGKNIKSIEFETAKDDNSGVVYKNSKLELVEPYELNSNKRIYKFKRTIKDEKNTIESEKILSDYIYSINAELFVNNSYVQISKDNIGQIDESKAKGIRLTITLKKGRGAKSGIEKDIITKVIKTEVKFRNYQN